MINFNTKILISALIIFSSNLILISNSQAQVYGEKETTLITQSVGGIVKEVSLEEIPNPAMTAAKAVSGADFKNSRIEIQTDGSLRYILRGKNQQGFIVEVQVTSQGTISQIDEQIDPSGVPEVPMKAFKKWAANDELISTWRSTRLGETFYQFVIDNYWLEISPNADKVMIFKEKIKY
jgi:hypothetical protein